MITLGKMRKPAGWIDAVVPGLLLVVLFSVPVPDLSGKSLLGLPSICLWRTVTGIPCPGCGGLRSLVCCAHGEWIRAFDFHPLGPMAFAGLIAWSAVALARHAESVRVGRIRFDGPWRTRSGWVLGALFALVWSGRMLGIFPTAP